MPPVKRNWKLIAETARKDAASASARARAANHAADAFRESVADALAALRASIEETSDTFDSGLESWPYDDCRIRLDATMTKLGLALKEKE